MQKQQAQEKDSQKGNRNADKAKVEDQGTEPTIETREAGSDEAGSEVEKLKLEVRSLQEKYIRQAAEFDNFRKRTAREKVEWMQTAGKDVIQSLLVVIDDMDRAEKQMEGTQDPELMKQGVHLIFQKFRNILQAKGLKQMNTLGEDFNPDLHEAISEIPAPSPELKGKVVDELEKGYYLNDKILRFAKVVVGK